MVPTLMDDLEAMGGLVLEELGLVEAEKERQQFGPVAAFPPPSRKLFLVL